jgi:uncharacterized protein
MRYNIKVIPNAKREKLVEEAGRFKVYLNAPAVDGKANEALIVFLAEHFGKKKRDITIIRGLTSREKIVEIGE